MRTSSTFSILFWMYAKKIKNNQAPHFARITADKKNSILASKEGLVPKFGILKNNESREQVKKLGMSLWNEVEHIRNPKTMSEASTKVATYVFMVTFISMYI